MIGEFQLFETNLSGIHLIEAGAGTGKTYNITGLYIRSLLERKLLPSSLLVLTFTKPATAELRSRIRMRIRETIDVLKGAKPTDDFLRTCQQRYQSAENIAHLKKAYSEFDECVISTIHGFCQRILNDFPIEFSLPSSFEIVTDPNTLHQEAIDSVWRSLIIKNERTISAPLLELIAANYQNPDKMFALLKPVLDQPYASLKPETKNLTDFDSDLQNIRTQFNALKKAWAQDKEALTAIVISAAVNKNKYQNIDQRIEEVEAWIEGGNPFAIVPTKLPTFGNDLPSIGLRKNQQVETLSLYNAVDSYLIAKASIEPAKTSFLALFINLLRTKIAALKEERRLLTYQDLLLHVEQGLVENPALAQRLRKQFSVALVDEFQDTDSIQYSIFNRIYKDAKSEGLFMIGDPKQAIYRFRNADIHTYLRAKKDAPEKNRYTLSYNYRSSQALLRGLNKLFQSSEHPFKMDGLEFVEAKYPHEEENQEQELFINAKRVPAFQLFSYNGGAEPIKTIDQKREVVYNSTVTEICRLLSGQAKLGQRPVQANDIAILVPKHKQAQEVQNKLAEKGIKSIINSKESVFKSPEAISLQLVLTAILQPGNERLIRAALLSSFIALPASELQVFQNKEEDWADQVAIFYTLNKRWKKWGFLDFANELLRTFDIERTLSKQPTAERAITNLFHLIELLGKEYVHAKPAPQTLLGYLNQKISDENTKGNDEDLIRLESDEELIQILTIHASKGLEFPIVFCPFLWDLKPKTRNKPLPSISNGSTTSVILETEGDMATAVDAQITEELNAEFIRLIYVAITRAESACFLHLMQSEKTAFTEFMDPVIDDLKSGNEAFMALRSMSFESIPVPENKWKPEHSRIQAYQRTNLYDVPKILSFSQLSGSDSVDETEEIGFDFDDDQTEKTEMETDAKTMFTLPKGKETGTFLHTLFEEIDFTDPRTIEPVLNEELENYPKLKAWHKPLLKQVHEAVKHPLFSECSLQQISKDNRIVEMEFHFPLENSPTKQMLSIIRGDIVEDEALEQGYLKGFIDLIFHYKQQYFILDYKSNYLGDQFSDYSKQALSEQMKHSNYDLQYHIYTLALHRFLELRIPEYSYETHFGGAIYFFLRGMNPLEPTSGVFIHKPDFKLIQQLNKLVKGERNV